MPVPGTVTPEPVPLEQVTEQAQPSASSTEVCVVEPGPLTDAGAMAAASSAAATSRTSGARSMASRWASARTSLLPPALGGGFVKTSRPR
jgi:hypothetical protein